MPIKSLNDLKAGDTGAFRRYDYCSWWSDEVLTTTERCIIIKSEPDVKSKKNNGFATQKEYTDYQITVVTPEIQDEWDRREYKKLILDFLQYRIAEIPIAVIKEAVIVSLEALNQNEYSKSLYAICLKEILSAHSTSSENLKKILQLLQTAVKQ